MGAKIDGPIGWNLQATDHQPQNEYEKKYREVLTELAKFVGAACNTGDIKAYKFLINHIALIMQSGFDILKEVIDDKKSKILEKSLKKIGISKN